jgi:hypothetical protein
MILFGVLEYGAMVGLLYVINAIWNVFYLFLKEDKLKAMLDYD